jgi:putative aminopeptidase FrvX
MKNYIELIEKLTVAAGASGFEDDVVKEARAYCDGFAATRENSIRNLYISRKQNTGGKSVVMLDAHSDEVSFMVQCIKPDGTLRFIPLGSIHESNIPAHRVRVQTRDGSYIPGIVASKPPHLQSSKEMNALPAIEDMCIDIGSQSAQETIEEYGIRVAAPAVPDVHFEYDEKHDTMIGKAFDCRLGCASILATLDTLKGEELGVDVVGAMAVQEEVGMRGANVTARTVKPDIAIVFEGCPADDTVVEPYMIQTAIRKGPMLRHIDRGMITHPRFQRHALDMAEKKGIPVRQMFSPFTTSGQAVISKVRCRRQPSGRISPWSVPRTPKLPKM